MAPESRHKCFVYEGHPSQQLPVLAAEIKKNLNWNYRCLYLNSPPMVQGMHSCLATIGIDVPGRIAKGSLVLSSEPTVSEDGSFDTGHMMRKLEDALDQALKDRYKGLFATGDMTWEFGAKENFAKLLKYEKALENLFQKRPELNGICQYHSNTLTREVMRQGLLSHGAIFINETLSRINQYYIASEQQVEKASENSDLDQVITELTRGAAIQ